VEDTSKRRVLKPLVNVIVKVYTNIEISTSVGTAKATLPPTSGGKQGDNPCPVLFVFVFAIHAAAEPMNEKMALPLTRLVGFIRNEIQ
jgi:hypothetical protein